MKRPEAVLRDPVGWKELKNGVEVRYTTVQDPERADLSLICRSEDRRQKGSAIHAVFEKRIEGSLKRLEGRLLRAQKAVARGVGEREVGRMLERDQRSGRLFRIEFQEAPERPVGLRLVWEKDAAEKSGRESSEGGYILRTGIRDWPEEAVWSTDIQLTRVESAFRVQKSGLEVRPSWRQKKERVQAHILVCFLAHVLWKMLEPWQSRARLGNSPRTILEELGEIQSGDVLLPMTTGEVLRLRCLVRPEKAQKSLLQRLGTALPRRMRAPNFVPEM